MTLANTDTIERKPTPQCHNAFIRKMSRMALLSEEDMAALASISSRVRVVQAGSNLAEQGEVSEGAMILLAGFACRYRRTADGRRQIVAFLLPGDLCDLDYTLSGRIDHGIGAVTACDVAHVAPGSLSALTERHPQVASALRSAKVLEEIILRDWLVSIGQHSGTERLGRLLCELFDRMQAVGLAEADSCYFPLVQPALAGATGMSLVHVNRSLRALKLAGLINYKGKRLQISDITRLHGYCEYSSRINFALEINKET